jgi:DNA-binding NarL/FixJ family response regulator
MTSPCKNSSQFGKRKILLVDDHPIVRQGLSQLINQEADLTVCGEAENASSAMEAITASRPDLVIVDISLDGPDGLDLLKTVRIRDATLPVLILSMHDEFLYAERALRAGARGYIMKQAATDGLLVAIRKILSGDIYLSERMSARLLRQLTSHPAPVSRSPLEDLSDRELEVFRLIGQGHGTREIAEMLHLSVKTVEAYQAHIKEKLSLKNSRELMQRAVQWTTSQQAAVQKGG